METISITTASRRGISQLVASAEKNQQVILSRHGQPVAEIVSTQEMATLRDDREKLRDAALILARFLTDCGERTDLDEALDHFGLTRAELEAELASELHTV
ncbi:MULTISPECIES: type II toxin-antitoxin system prevent-host-death family antitoxin [unclassified Corynebacterium]|uniref:type II toxin-antitoxin system prevent-host-death family antitoxin n=1 Tax=unclassified Corynebacterium TaxID=2624378 RepID=UPI0029C9C28E|nr:MULTISPECIES: type II toxin-antitoxin system prevent-host-death family antitoxin [unclassified Corynebacterium]WPF66337.1 type II toxin-antitoxin system prevent-host-death family antitoxin [Corynebacterium sp. 22KM0430]WPF68827.1 type II toxin-antitoxin system prevent-host-death family antitoxin [Corynebacterium sp. 21KM1197]